MNTPKFVANFTPTGYDEIRGVDFREKVEQMMADETGSVQCGAPEGNRNRLRHGLRCGRLPAGCGTIRRSVDQVRLQLENEVLQAKGAVDVTDAATIQTACKWHSHSMLCQRWLRLSIEELTHAERLNYSREVASASAARDKAIASLNLKQGRDSRPFDFLTTAEESK